MLRRSNMLIEIEQYGKVVRSRGATYPIFLPMMLWDKLCALASSREKKKSPHPLVRACPDDYREGVAQLGLQIDFLKSNSI